MERLREAANRWVDRLWPRTRPLLYALGLLAASGYVFATFLIDPNLTHYLDALFGDTIQGLAHRPFVYRALVPWCVRALMAVAPHQLLEALTQSWGVSELLALARVPGPERPEFLVCCMLMFASLLGFLWAVRRLFLSLYGRTRETLATASGLPFAALLLLLSCFRYTSYVYDFPTLFLFTWGLVLLAEKRWTEYLPLYAVACVNKETTILLALVFLIHFRADRTLPARRYAGLFLIQVMIWLAIGIAIHASFSGNPGATVEHHLKEHNLDYALFHPVSFATAAAALAMAALIGHRWADKPRFLRVALLILPAELGFTLFFGYIDELRDYYEALPVVLLLLTHGYGSLVQAGWARTGDHVKAAA